MDENVWIPAFAGMTGGAKRGSAGGDSRLITGNGLGYSRLDSRFRGNDGGAKRGSAGGDSRLISSGWLGCSRLDSRFRGNGEGTSRERGRPRPQCRAGAANGVLPRGSRTPINPRFGKQRANRNGRLTMVSQAFRVLRARRPRSRRLLSKAPYSVPTRPGALSMRRMSSAYFSSESSWGA